MTYEDLGHHVIDIPIRNLNDYYQDSEHFVRIVKAFQKWQKQSEDTALMNTSQNTDGEKHQQKDISYV